MDIIAPVVVACRTTAVTSLDHLAKSLIGRFDYPAVRCGAVLVHKLIRCAGFFCSHDLSSSRLECVRIRPQNGHEGKGESLQYFELNVMVWWRW